MTTHVQPIVLTETVHSVTLAGLPPMPAIFGRLLMSALFKKNRVPAHGRVTRVRLHLNGVTPDPEKILRYRRVCGFSHGPDDLTVPSGFLQTLFIGLLGRYITSDFFPIDPMGLIQTGQQFDSMRPARIGDRLDLSCTLQEMAPALKGISTRFLLEAHRDGQPVWQGISTYLTRTVTPGKKDGKTIQDHPLPIRMTIRVPSGTGRRYAGVSGDYNPHHLSDVTARIIGFRQAMVHGMWSLARTLAGLEPLMDFTSPHSVDAAFKLPVYMPATLSLGCMPLVHSRDGYRIFFDLRDAATRRPHLKGSVTRLTKGR